MQTKRILSLLLSVALLLGLTACGSREEQHGQTEQSVETVTLGSQPVEITFWHCASDLAGQRMEAYIQEFNETNPYQITVKAAYQGQYADATTLIKAILSAENYSKLPDVMQMDSTGKVAYYNSGKAYTVEKALAEFPVENLMDSYWEAACANWQFSGSQLGLPFATSTTVTYYNADLLAQAGWDRAPETFGEVMALAADWKTAGGEQAVMQTIPNSPTLSNWLCQLGSYLVDESNGSDGTATRLACVENGALATFLAAWKELYESGAILNEDSSTDAFVAGDVLLMIGSSSKIASVLSKVGERFPVGVSGYLRVNDSASAGASLSGSCLAMFDSGDALRRAAAWEFVRYLTSGEVQADFAAGTGYIPAHVDAENQPVYQEALAATPQYLPALEQVQSTSADMRSVTVGPAADFYYAIMQGCSDMLTENLSVEETVERMSQELNGLLDKYLRDNPS